MKVLHPLCLAALALLAITPGRPVAQQRQEQPRLIVLLVVDQMRRDYIEAYGMHWKKGLRRIVVEQKTRKDVRIDRLQSLASQLLSSRNMRSIAASACSSLIRGPV